MAYPQLLTAEEQLAAAKANLALPPVVCICGSLRYQVEMHAAAAAETIAGRIVVMPHATAKLWHPRGAAAVKDDLDDLHQAKLRLADEVLIVGDYVGDRTRAEIAYARSLGKRVRFTRPEVDPDRAGEVAR